MAHSHDFDFSFSGLKTAVLYLVKKIGTLDDATKIAIAHEFQNAALEVLVKKTVEAARANDAKTIIVGGGVSANKKLHELLAATVTEKLPHTKLLFPAPSLSTDNATMVALAGYSRFLHGQTLPPGSEIIASGNLQLS